MVAEAPRRLPGRDDFAAEPLPDDEAARPGGADQPPVGREERPAGGAVGRGRPGRGDERPRPGWLAALLDTYERTGAAGVTGPVYPDYEGEPDPWLVAAGIFIRKEYPDGTEMPAAGTGNLLLDSRQALLAEHRLIDKPPNGLGDLTAAVYLARILSGQPPIKALQSTTAAVYEILARTAKRGGDELQLETDAQSLSHPMAMVQLRHLTHPGRDRRA